VAKVYLAYRCSHLFGGAMDGTTEDREHLVDADADQHALVRRVNAHFATPEQMRFERGIKHEIPAFAMKSERQFGGGGGCSTYSWLEIREAPRLPDVPDGVTGTGGETLPQAAASSSETGQEQSRGGEG
jgi:hypothetical protein